MKKLIKLFAALPLLMAISCSTPKQVLDLDSAPDSKQIEMKNGSTYLLKVKENPSTGYSWSTNVSDDCSVSVGSSYKQDDSPAEMVGVGGVRTFTLKANKAGKCTIVLLHSRGGSEPVSTKTINVSVK